MDTQNKKELVAINPLTWSDYKAMTEGGLESAEQVEGVFQRLTGLTTNGRDAKEVYVTVVKAVRSTTKAIREELNDDK